MLLVCLRLICLLHLSGDCRFVHHSQSRSCCVENVFAGALFGFSYDSSAAGGVPDQSLNRPVPTDPTVNLVREIPSLFPKQCQFPASTRFLLCVNDSSLASSRCLCGCLLTSSSFAAHLLCYAWSAAIQRKSAVDEPVQANQLHLRWVGLAAKQHLRAVSRRMRSFRNSSCLCFSHLHLRA